MSGRFIAFKSWKWFVFEITDFHIIDVILCSARKLIIHIYILTVPTYLLILSAAVLRLFHAQHRVRFSCKFIRFSIWYYFVVRCLALNYLIYLCYEPAVAHTRRANTIPSPHPPSVSAAHCSTPLGWAISNFHHFPSIISFALKLKWKLLLLFNLISKGATTINPKKKPSRLFRRESITIFIIITTHLTRAQKSNAFGWWGRACTRPPHRPLEYGRHCMCVRSHTIIWI